MTVGNGKRLAINMIANVIAFGVQFGINFLLTPYIVNTLGSEAYGFVPLATNFIGYIGIITVALNSMASRFLTIEMSQGHTKQAQVYFNSVLMANTVLALILAVPSVLVVVFVDKVMNVPVELLGDVQLTFAYALLGMEISLVLSVFGNVFYIKNRLELSAKRNIEGNVLRAVILVTLFAVFKPRIWFVTGTMMIVTIYLALANMYYTHKLTPELKIDRTKFSGKAVKTLLSSGVWNSVNQLSFVLLTTLDIYLANVFLGAQASGEYSLVKMVPNFIQSLVSVLVGVFIPQFTIYFARKQRKELLDSIDFSIKCMGYMLMLPVGFLMVFGADFFHVWVPSQNAQLLQGLSILTLVPMVVTCSINTIYNVYTQDAGLGMGRVRRRLCAERHRPAAFHQFGHLGHSHRLYGVGIAPQSYVYAHLCGSLFGFAVAYFLQGHRPRMPVRGDHGAGQSRLSCVVACEFVGSADCCRRCLRHRGGCDQPVRGV